MLPILLASSAPAVETGELPVTGVPDGDTITVTLDGEETRVRLKWVDTPEAEDNPHDAGRPEGRAASEFLRRLLPRRSTVKLWHPGDEFERDEQGRVVAVALRRVRDDHGGESWRPLQAEIVAAGWSVYWRRYGDAPDPLGDELAEAMRRARDARAGAWASAEEWMSAKARERPHARKR